MLPRPLLRLLILLLGLLYLGGVCELDRDEARQNFAKECHDALLTVAAVDPPAAVATTPTRPGARQRPEPGQRAVWPGVRVGAGAGAGWPPAPAVPPPLWRRWLRCAVLQV